jgi:hypothetical protein
MTTNLTVNADLLCQTTCEMLGIGRESGETSVEPLGRDARIESHNGIDFLAMDDAGEGEFARAMGPIEAAELVRSGLVRDAR